MLGKSGWLMAALAALFLAISSGGALARGGDDAKWGRTKLSYGKHYKKHYGKGYYGHKHNGHRHKYYRKHKRRHAHDGHNRHKRYGYKPFKYYGKPHYRPYRPRYQPRHQPSHRHSGRHKYVYDDGRCRVVVKSGRHGYKEVVKCDGAYPKKRFIPQALIYTGPPPAVAQGTNGIVWNEPQAPSQARPQNPPAYEVNPTRTYYGPDGRYCREYQTSTTVAGRVQEAYGQACRQPDGSWELVQ